MSAADQPKISRAAQFARARTAELRLPSGKSVIVVAPEYATAFALGLLPDRYRDVIGRYIADTKSVMARPLDTLTDDDRLLAYGEMMQVIDCTCVVACVDPVVRFVANDADEVALADIDPLDRMSIWRWTVKLPEPQ